MSRIRWSFLVGVAGLLAGSWTAWGWSYSVQKDEPVRPSEIRKILFLGNSITHHSPSPAIDWHGDWGMAATAPEKDYVHLVTAAVAERTGREVEIRVRNIADFEQNFSTYEVAEKLNELFNFEADLVILAIGENVSALETEEAGAGFQAGVAKILAGASANHRPILVVRSSFWPNEAKDRRLQAAAEAAGALFVDAGPLGRDEANAAHSEHPYQHAGVGAHPGDRGMKAIADLIVDAVFKEAGTSPAVP